jgi:hypothetical protein
MANIYINPRQLNINTILKKHIEKINVNANENGKNNNGNYVNNNINSDITIINNILNNNNVQNNKISNNKISNNKYNIVKYLGEGIQGSLYLANDSAKKRYICKKILLNSNNPETIKQIELELNLLKYLSSNNVTKEYINPCIEHKIIDNNIFTIFPVFDGYSLNHLEKYLKKLDSNSYYKIVFHLIKTILHGLAKIHQYNIAHQNINNNSILVSTYKNPKEISIKFTDFGLGCGNSNENENVKNLVNIADYEKDNETVKSFLKFNSCKGNAIPISITEKVIPDLVNNNFLLISQKYDLFCLAIIFSKLLLFFENMNLNLKNGYNKENEKSIIDIIDTKYLSILNTKKKIDYKNIFPYINVNDDVKKDILEYLKLFREYVLCKTANRQTCQYLLDKLIIYEKYKNETF